jgi:ATP-dependent helicase HepA
MPPPAKQPWQVHDRLIHRDNPDLGPGRVLGIQGRMIAVVFPRSGQMLKMAANSEALRPLVIEPGNRVRVRGEGAIFTVVSFQGDLRGDLEADTAVDNAPADPADRTALLSNGELVHEDDLWPAEPAADLLERLKAGQVDSDGAFALRIAAMHLDHMRLASGFGSFLGGRVRLFPHQLHVAERATRQSPVRWLLADEVGLGKTVESCLILNHLVRTGQAERVLVVAPEALTVQWLGELWRKYHQVFVLIDDQRLLDVERAHGEGFNPFDVYRRVVMSRERLEKSPRLVEQAVEAGIDLLVVDEAHHLRRDPGHPGNAAYRAIEPIAALQRHFLLLTAVPLEEDLHGFFRLLQLLRPNDFASFESFAEALEAGQPLPPCTSATRRTDIGGLAPRQHRPVMLPDDGAWAAQEALLEAVVEHWVEEAAKNADKSPGKRVSEDALVDPVRSPAAKRQAETVWWALNDPGRLVTHTSTRKFPRITELAAQAAEHDPRVRWLEQEAPKWQRAGDKTLLFVHDRETLERLKPLFERGAHAKVGVFHEELSPKRRDIEVAQFRLGDGPSLLISTESGGEGRNFEFCTRLILFDLPWRPMAVEQRIGRLDRIGRSLPVEIVTFEPPRGFARWVVDLYQRLGLFERPLSSLEAELGQVEPTLQQLAARLDLVQLPESEVHERFDELLERAQRSWDRVQRAAFRELHREPYSAELEQSILERIPPDLDRLTQQVVVGTARRLNLQVEEHRGGVRHSIQVDSRAKVESLPGLAGEHSFFGSFQRESAVEDEMLDFFASGHPLVEGLLAHLDEAPLGRAAFLEIEAGSSSEPGEEAVPIQRGFGILAILREGIELDAVAVDPKGRQRQEWARFLLENLKLSRHVQAKKWSQQAAWQPMIDSLGEHLEAALAEHPGELEALAFFRLR